MLVPADRRHLRLVALAVVADVEPEIDPADVTRLAFVVRRDVEALGPAREVDGRPVAGIAALDARRETRAAFEMLDALAAEQRAALREIDFTT